ncbi:uncharacterized protein LAJ45_03937 [Morchella importuna]|uniref:uncharacterized protein n=1 Tax=Morchella importuna TaxID=1174673 RepID=UPI001E8E7995|nr:uncharacterized protein LAJ45_03937 [Morchella importuna]KAH8151944.1 hypothetical protein LAJ45_03937 [Morchella importuna]
MDEPIPTLTVFTPAASCGQILSISSLLYENGNREFLRMDYGAPGVFMSRCFPPGFKTDTYHGGGYLPGPVCVALEDIEDKIRLGTRETAQHTYTDDGAGTKTSSRF